MPDNGLLHRALAAALHDKARREALSDALQHRSIPHLDDEDIAAFVDHAPRAAAIAHALHCRTCEARLEALAPVLEAHVLPPPIELPAWLHAAPMFATAQLRGETLHLLEHTGVHRYRSAETVRSGNTIDAIGLRDRADQPRWELQLMPEATGQRVRILAQWLDTATQPRSLRASVEGRILAEVPFRRRHAALSGLRIQDLRLDALADHPLAIAWLSLSAVR